MEYSDLSFGQRLKLAREGAGLTQDQLAERVGVDQVQVSKWELGITRPRSDRLQPIAVAIGEVRYVNWLVSGTGKAPRGVPALESERLTDSEEGEAATDAQRKRQR